MMNPPGASTNDKDKIGKRLESYYAPWGMTPESRHFIFSGHFIHTWDIKNIVDHLVGRYEIVRLLSEDRTRLFLSGCRYTEKLACFFRSGLLSLFNFSNISSLTSGWYFQITIHAQQL